MILSSYAVLCLCQPFLLGHGYADPIRGTFLSPLSPELKVSVNMALVDSGSSDCELRQGFLEAGQPLEQEIQESKPIEKASQLNFVQ